jgi:hypothetical protein
LTLDFETDSLNAGRLTQWKFHQLYARPMVQLDLHAGMTNGPGFKSWIKNTLEELPPDSVVKLKVHDKISEDAMNVLRAPSLRSLAPRTMNIDATFTEYRSHSTTRIRP